MFKNQFTTKTEAPLKDSDRRKLRASVAQTYLLETHYLGSRPLPLATIEKDNGLADVLVPEGIRSTKFKTSLGLQGVNTYHFLSLNLRIV